MSEILIKEIAIRLNKSEGTVKAHLYHARQKLRILLTPNPTVVEEVMERTHGIPNPHYNFRDCGADIGK